jgi:hypothetical protein
MHQYFCQDVISRFALWPMINSIQDNDPSVWTQLLAGGGKT